MTAAVGGRRLLVGRYELGDEVGRGRSVVFRARDTLLGRHVAVKQVELTRSPDPVEAGAVRARVLREARALARVRSPLVVEVYDVIDEPDAVWLVMELVRAPSLERLVRHGGPLDERRAARIGLAVLDALEAAHAQGIVHRDVKPANVLVGHVDDALPSSPDATVKLADFGVAMLGDDTALTSPGLVIGSPSYMAPEQAMGRGVGPAADMWALGALLYFAVEGRPPFQADSALATATAVVHGEPCPQQRPGRLSRVISLLLDKRPEHRPDAHRVRAILRPVAVDEQVTVDTTDVVALHSPPGPSSATQGLAVVPSRARPRRSGPRRALLTAAAAVVVAGAASLTGFGNSDAHPQSDGADPPVLAPPDSAAVSAGMAPDAGVATGSDARTGADDATPAATPAPDEAAPLDPAVAPEAAPSPEPVSTTTPAPSAPDVTGVEVTVPDTTTPDVTTSTTVPPDPPPDTTTDQSAVDGSAVEGT